ncbi:HAD superfamily hydrolase (TIGR01509 family) [Glycomyces algeriensis]|uniref:Haloacid dehalogenase n=1 Tax=Glycomyces algeriensis TaxID=256037 RepID=A0A9W6GBD9_9ACTN|nr:HAD family phosphatase [Glycomyces algeriensis]MDA1365397.1 HAD family phosphatase [Glycomyces algeriensis]MDR7351082.1 HAD superfamily hydrolase (TIGR01509 family) [Glycomyces algeriensis]GLI43795.1 haloacid dehalogenase [Glycomyces algeriensis]
MTDQAKAFPQAVLFDMDGTLVDSEIIWDTGVEELAALLGGALDPEVRARMVGTNEDASVVMLLDSLGIPLTEAPHRQTWLRTRMKELFAAGVEWKPGARELLLECRAAGIPTALVTSTPRELADIIIGHVGAENFDLTVCGDEVEKPKPDPRPYLSAAATLGVDIERCVVVEDSVSGVGSALAAGAVTLAVPGDVELPVDLDVKRLDSLRGIDLAYLRSLG